MPQRLKDLQETARERAKVAQERLKELQERVQPLEEAARDARARASEAAREYSAVFEERRKAAEEAMPPGLLTRVLSSLVGIPLLLALMFVEVNPNLPGVVFTGGVAVIALLCAGEYFRALRARFQPNASVAYVAVVILQFAAWNVSRGQVAQLLPILLVVLTIATLVLQVLRREQEPLSNLGVTFFGVVYIGWLLSYLVQIRSIPGLLAPWGLPNLPMGAWLVLYLLLITWLNDTGAYLVGARIGKTKLAPKLSPKKTVEGAIGGLVFATLTAIGVGLWLKLPWQHTIFLGPLLGILGQVGDLCESALKRDLGIKDFGGIMPGHGGLLDRFDSILFTAPIAYYYLAYVLHQPK
ncbi:MAG: phosphatidate cytidylyltransferase [Armatimonas sp.]